MDFKAYLNQSWNDHATNSEKIASEFSQNQNLIENNDQISQFAGLVTHVMGEHLAQWEKGVVLLSQLQEHRHFLKDTETEKALLRSVASLKIAGQYSNEDLSIFDQSNQVRILAIAASALSEKDTQRSKDLLQRAVDISESLEQKDPAFRALAITGNNLACALEEKSNRSNQETDLMLKAAQTARKNWERAGGWLEISRAEYRLAMSYLKANDLSQALKHAQACVELCLSYKADHLDLFFAYEVLASVEKARSEKVGFELALAQAKDYFDKLSDDDKSWCEPSLKKLA